MDRAKSIGIVYDRISGRVLRVINPDFEIELDLHSLASDEVMQRRVKTADTMTFTDVARIIDDFVIP